MPAFRDETRVRAQKIARKMGNDHLGIEHLFIALLEGKESIAQRYVVQKGISPDALIEKIGDRIRNTVRGTPQEIVETPRVQRVFHRADRYAQERNEIDFNERDLIFAILSERSGLFYHTLRHLGIDYDEFAQFARNFRGQTGLFIPQVDVHYNPEIENPQAVVKAEYADILRHMFSDYAHITVEQIISGGFTSAVILIVVPYRIDGQRDASVIVKIDRRDDILEEYRQYQQFVQNTLPPFTARVETRPTSVNGRRLAGLKYTLVSEGIDDPPRDLRMVIAEWSGERLGEWLENSLYPTFGKHWWDQKTDYQFTAWEEYDYLLPPLLVLDYAGKGLTSDLNLSTVYLDPTYSRDQLDTIEIGHTVVIQDFLIRRIREKSDPTANTDVDIIQVASKSTRNRELALKVEIRGVEIEKELYHLNEELRRIAGTVWKTRDDILLEHVRALEADFDIYNKLIPYSYDRALKCPNPLDAYKDILMTQIRGTRSTLHGDMHLGNIMVGPSDMPVLIDFARARRGHRVFDWVMLETSILSHVVMPCMGDSWDDVRQVAETFAYLNTHGKLPEKKSQLAQAFAAVIAVRKIARKCLSKDGQWAEYFVGLSLNCLRAVQWRDSTPLQARRLMYLVSGIAMQRVRNATAVSTNSSSDSDTAHREEDTRHITREDLRTVMPSEDETKGYEGQDQQQLDDETS